MIEKVILKPLKKYIDKRGFLLEILRLDWQNFFIKFGQAYITCCKKGFVKGWHYHKKQWDNFCIIRGKARVILCDLASRRASPKAAQSRTIKEYILSENKPMILRIPPLVAHGFECIEGKETWILNLPTRVYNYSSPDEFRIPLQSDEIPYKRWRRKKGW